MNATVTPLPFDMPTPPGAFPAIDEGESAAMQAVEVEAEQALRARAQTSARIDQLRGEISALAATVRSRLSRP